MTTPASTELDAVNTMLDVIGEAPVSTIEDVGLVDAAMALDLLRRTSREVQTRRWYWNTDKGFELVPTAPLPGDILVPPDTLRCDPSDRTVAASVRQGRLWNNRDLTFQWTESVRCDITRFLPFEDIPEAARQYIAIRAARKFQDRRLGSEARNGLTEKDEMRALVTLENDQAESADMSMADHWSVQRALNPWAPLGGFGGIR
jgi:hypothetical protein